jgi:hypothetical protein
LDRSVSNDGSYPATKEDANDGMGLSKSSDTEYTYSLVSDTYCLSAISSSTGIAFHVSSDNGTIEEGVCGGGAGTGLPPAGGGLAFDGQGDFLRVASSPSLNITNNLTVETWVKPSTTTADDNWRTVVGKLEGGTGGYELGVEVDQSIIYFDVQLSGGIVATSYTFPTLDTWYHVVGTFQVYPTMKLYVNGVLVDDTPDTYGGGPFNGNILTSSRI